MSCQHFPKGAIYFTAALMLVLDEESAMCLCLPAVLLPAAPKTPLPDNKGALIAITCTPAFAQGCSLRKALVPWLTVVLVPPVSQ
jgi:hypothetical protein